MGTLKEKQPQAGPPSSSSPFASDSVLGRLARGGDKPTDADLAELNKLAQTGNRAERRAAARHLKKQGITARPAAPTQPVVAPAAPQDVKKRPAKKALAVKQAAAKATEPKKQAPVIAATKKTAVKKAAVKKAAPKKTAE